MRAHAQNRAVWTVTSALIALQLSACTSPAVGSLGERSPLDAVQTRAALPGLPPTEGTILLSLEENGLAHLFAVRPGDLPLTRLTQGEWNDTDPAISPDGSRLAFASDRSGYWDLYVLDLDSGEVVQRTNTPQYDSAPSWSPDAEWLAFETYIEDNLEVAILRATGQGEEPVRLTQNHAADHSPAWSPDGRRIAFVSTTSGSSDVWLADLDLVDADRFRNLTSTPDAAEGHPAWSSDGASLAWFAASPSSELSGIFVLDMDQEGEPPRWIGGGERVAWQPSGENVATTIPGANRSFLSAIDLQGNIQLPALALPGTPRGLDWGPGDVGRSLPPALDRASRETPVPLWSPVVAPASDVPGQRSHLVSLEGVQAPYAKLHDLVDESFTALRSRVLLEAGWDALANLQNAFVPLSASLEPGFQDDWLYTGRAFAINSLMSDAGWLVAVREDIGPRTYWRLYIRCTAQDGSLGEPLHHTPWDLGARYELDPDAYERGGRYVDVPAGYWLDVTALASAYGWERLPALPNWRSYFAGARFTEFALTGGLSWRDAMLELYPPDALVTPTRVLPPTVTPTRTPRPSATPGPSPTPRPTMSPTTTGTASATPLPTSTPPTIIP